MLDFFTVLPIDLFQFSLFSTFCWKRRLISVSLSENTDFNLLVFKNKDFIIALWRSWLSQRYWTSKTTKTSSFFNFNSALWELLYPFFNSQNNLFYLRDGTTCVVFILYCVYWSLRFIVRFRFKLYTINPDDFIKWFSFHTHFTSFLVSAGLSRSTLKSTNLWKKQTSLSCNISKHGRVKLDLRSDASTV